MCVFMWHVCVYLGDSFSSPVEGDIGVSVSVIGCWPLGSVLYICLLTGCSVTNQAPRLHRGNQIATHSLWASAGHPEIPVMFYLYPSHTLMHTLQYNLSVLSLSLQEIAAYLITFEKHDEWLTTSPKTR